MIVVSAEGLDDARLTQAQFPHLLVLSDEGQGLSEAADLLDAIHRGPDDSAIYAPTTILVDRHGTVRWLYRPGEIITRRSPDEVLQAIDQHGHTRP